MCLRIFVFVVVGILKRDLGFGLPVDELREHDVLDRVVSPNAAAKGSSY